MKHSFLTIVFGLLSFCAFADTTNVTVHIGTASGRVHFMIGAPGDYYPTTNSVFFSIEATLDNQTGASLTVTGRDSVFDSMCLVVLDSSGRELAIQPYGDAFATTTGKSFTLPTGKTTKRLVFINCMLPSAAQLVRIRLKGGLQNSSYSSYTGSITSNVVDVIIPPIRWM